jgi:hypothetical protein
MINTQSFFDEMSKLADVSAEEAASAYKRLKQLDKDKPTVGQLGRGALVGAVAAPTAGIVSKMIAGGPKKGLVEGARNLAGQAASGAIYGGGMPYVRHKLEHRAEEEKLKDYLGKSKRGKLRGQIQKTLGV